MDMHDAVAALKSIAIELGRSPTKNEFCSRVPGASHAANKFGFTALLQAAGLETYSERRTKKALSNAVFEKSIEAHLGEKTESPPIERKPWPKIAVISDIHWPFSSETVLSRFLSFIKKHQPELVVINGDAWDMYSHAKFPRSHNVFTPREEQTAARRMNEDFWKEVKRLCPSARCVQLMGNHDVRPLKRILEAYPAAEDWIEKALRDAFTFDGVETIYDPRQELIVGDIAIFHGYRSQLGAHRDFTLMNCVNGHTHQGGCVFKKLRNETLWELNSGLAGNPTGKGLTYTAQKLSTWTPGFGWVDEDGPRFIPC